MNKIIYRKTTKADMKILMKLRLEMLREVNGFPVSMNMTRILSLRAEDILSQGNRLQLLRLMEKLL